MVLSRGEWGEIVFLVERQFEPVKGGNKVCVQIIYKKLPFL